MKRSLYLSVFCLLLTSYFISSCAQQTIPQPTVEAPVEETIPEELDPIWNDPTLLLEKAKRKLTRISENSDVE